MPKKLYTYFGNKEKIAPKVWEMFGPTKAYAEPFAGCGSVLLSCPYEHSYEVLNDFDCHIANVFRSVKYHPDETIKSAIYPRCEADLHTRHTYLYTHREALRDLILSDPKACNPELAGWWIWGINLWIGSGWCTDGAAKIRQKPVARNQGILTMGQNRREIVTDMINAVHDRLIDVNICCGDFARVLTPSYTTKFGLTAVFLDPPYTDTFNDCENDFYQCDVTDTVKRVRQWFLDNYKNPLYRIILCSNGDDWIDAPTDINKYQWKRNSGMCTDKEQSNKEIFYYNFEDFEPFGDL